MSDVLVRAVGLLLGVLAWAIMWFYVLADPCTLSILRNGAEKAAHVNVSSCAKDDLAGLLRLAADTLGLSGEPLTALRLLDHRGERVDLKRTVRQVLNAGGGRPVFLLHRREHWHWPVLAKGDVLANVSIGGSGPTLRIEALLMHPRVFLVDGLLSDGELAEAAALADGALGEAGLQSDGTQSARIVPGRSALVDTLDARIFALLRIPRDSGLDEPLAVERRPDGHSCQWDLLGGLTGNQRHVQLETCDRMATVVVSLSAGADLAFCYITERGGFRSMKGSSDARSDCTGAFRVQPRPGQAVLFYSIQGEDNAGGAPVRDQLAYRAGCGSGRDVTTLTKWVHNRACPGAEELADLDRALERARSLYLQ